MAQDFYPFVENGAPGEKDVAPSELPPVAEHPARIAVYDDASAAPRVVVVEAGEVRAYLEEITATVNRLVREQGGAVPFMVIREIVENFIHAYFQAPTISILDGGNTIRFSDQGPGIPEKARALEYGTSSATEEMKRYIRGVGSGLPYVQQYMEDKGGSLEIEDNIQGGTVVTISTRPAQEARAVSGGEGAQALGPVAAQQGWQQDQPWQQGPQAQPWQQPQGPTWQQGPAQPWPQGPQAQPWQQAQAGGWYQPQPWQQAAPAPGWPAPVQGGAQTSWQPQKQTPAGAPAGALPQQPQITLDERSSQAMSYLAEHGSAGPTDLVRSLGSSGATWSRVLSSMAAQGLVMKVGQKYQLTGIGRAFI